MSDTVETEMRHMDISLLHYHIGPNFERYIVLSVGVRLMLSRNIVLLFGRIYLFEMFHLLFCFLSSR